MPKITIKEVDLTNPGLIDESSNVVYVPGIAKKLPKDFERYQPRLYTNLSDFQNDFGDKVPVMTTTSSTDTDAHPTFDTSSMYDSGYIYATELLRLGCPVLYDCMSSKSENYETLDGTSTTTIPNDGNYWIVPSATETTLNGFITAAKGTNSPLNTSNSDNILLDKGLYDIKFVSNGGYSELNSSISYIATTRQDCVAIIDIKYDKNVSNLINSTEVKDTTIEDTTGISYDSTSSKYYSLFAPWGIYKPTCLQRYHKTTASGDFAVGDNGAYTYYPEMVALPGSFGYLVTMANAIRNGANKWVAMAGATRGGVPMLQSLKEDITQATIDKLQSREGISVNPIATINPFGILVWGNRTLYNNKLKGNLTSSSFLNIRNLCSDVKKTIWAAARKMTFEQNSDILWLNFKSYITPILDQMVTSGCLAGYELKKRTNKQKAELSAVVRLYAIEAVEDFDIEIQLTDEATSITE